LLDVGVVFDWRDLGDSGNGEFDGG
jgi:hypothetical protein